MKVYHRKNFIIGIFFLMLAAVLALISIPDEFTVKRIVLIVFGLIFGIALLASCPACGVSDNQCFGIRDSAYGLRCLSGVFRHQTGTVSERRDVI